MNVFLGDYVSLINSDLPNKPTSVVSGQITGIVLDDYSELQFVYIAGIDAPLWMSDGWKFVEHEVEEEDA